MVAAGEGVDSPAWLVAGGGGFSGRNGRVYPTGDIVTLQEDGSLVFVGRKDDVVKVQGGSVDVASIEGQLVKHLGTETRVAAVIPTSLGEGSQQRGVVVFVEKSKSTEEEGIEILSATSETSLEVLCFKTTVQCTISIPMAAGLKKFDRFAQGSLASLSSCDVLFLLKPGAVQGRSDSAAECVEGLLGDLCRQIAECAAVNLSRFGGGQLIEDGGADCVGCAAGCEVCWP